MIGCAQRADDRSVFRPDPVEKSLAGGGGRIEERSFRCGADGSRRRWIIGRIAKDAIERRATHSVPANAHLTRVGIVGRGDLSRRQQRCYLALSARAGKQTVGENKD